MTTVSMPTFLTFMSTSQLTFAGPHAVSARIAIAVTTTAAREVRLPAFITSIPFMTPPVRIEFSLSPQVANVLSSPHALFLQFFYVLGQPPHVLDFPAALVARRDPARLLQCFFGLGKPVAVLIGYPQVPPCALILRVFRGRCLELLSRLWPQA